MDIIPFGTNGFFSSFGRQTACYVVSLGARLIILDAGSGLFRFAGTYGKRLLKTAERIDIFLSHPHMDHTFGFYAAFHLFSHQDVHVHGLSETLFFSEFACGSFFPPEVARTHKRFHFRSIAEGTHRLDGLRVQVRRQEHNGYGSLAFRFDFGLCYITDSEPVEESVIFVRDAPLLLHEHYLLGDLSDEARRGPLAACFSGGHTTTIGAARVASEARVDRLVLIHHHPSDTSRALVRHRHHARAVFPSTDCAMDMRSISL